VDPIGGRDDLGWIAPAGRGDLDPEVNTSTRDAFHRSMKTESRANLMAILVTLKMNPRVGPAAEQPQKRLK
jgi:hypothetical protein